MLNRIQKEIASPFATQKTRNDDFMASHASRVESDPLRHCERADKVGKRGNLFMESAHTPSLRGASTSEQRSNLSIVGDSSKEIASPFASQKSRNDDW